ncbi:sigma-70 family RNA polymerase sigma factor [Micromonospora sp. NPDC047707]|uniref:RNA polymerase sigma factor n=1 Tax=unclassified Micromonospora TaxID=2617518 RepID=UPI0012B4F9B1|nr:sigma-70 family RNA polymerase sigma factor [Micromonospora sp. WMMC415]
MGGLMSDDDEFLHAVSEHLDLVYNLARRLTRSRPAAEDLVQETYLRALRGWRRRPPEDVRAWLATICLNTARTGYRREAARPAEVLDPDAGVTLVSAHDTAAEAISAAVRDQVHQAMWQLPAAQREAITLMDLCGFTAAQVATMTGTPRGTILARVHRGHKRLAALLQQQGVTPGEA